MADRANLPAAREHAGGDLRRAVAASSQRVHATVYFHTKLFCSICKYVQIFMYTCTCIHTYMQVCVCVHINEYLYIYIYVCIYIYTYIFRIYIYIENIFRHERPHVCILGCPSKEVGFQAPQVQHPHTRVHFCLHM